MIKQRNGQAVARRRHSAEFKVEALGVWWFIRIGAASTAPGYTRLFSSNSAWFAA